MTNENCEMCGKFMGNVHGNRRFCKSCARKRRTQYSRRYHEAHREERNAKRRQWRLDNLDKVREYERGRRAEHYKATRRWKLNHPDEVREQHRRYREKHRVEIAAKERARRLAKRIAEREARHQRYLQVKAAFRASLKRQHQPETQPEVARAERTRRVKLVDKPCEMCGKLMVGVVTSRKYCYDCTNEHRRQWQNKYRRHGEVGSCDLQTESV